MIVKSYKGLMSDEEDEEEEKVPEVQVNIH